MGSVEQLKEKLALVHCCGSSLGHVAPVKPSWDSALSGLNRHLTNPPTNTEQRGSRSSWSCFTRCGSFHRRSCRSDSWEYHSLSLSGKFNPLLTTYVLMVSADLWAFVLLNVCIVTNSLPRDTLFFNHLTFNNFLD